MLYARVASKSRRIAIIARAGEQQQPGVESRPLFPCTRMLGYCMTSVSSWNEWRRITNPSDKPLTDAQTSSKSASGYVNLGLMYRF